MELNDVMRTTFAARDYTEENLPDQILYDIIDHARFAPSGGNRQGNRVIIIRELATRQSLAKLAEPAAKRYMAQVQAGENPWNTIIPSKVSQQQIDQAIVPDLLLSHYTEAAVVLVFLVDLREVASMDQHLNRVGIISGASIYPFVWNVLLGARQAGFGGTLTTLPAASEPEVQKLLRIPEHYAVCAVTPISKPIKQLSKLKRRSVEDIATLEQFDGEVFTKP
ncbi:MAG: nitroreductase family protein [Porticoccaceae bacterium]|nr:nitroreductase family protein [Porticoccaceae bacterium]